MVKILIAENDSLFRQQIHNLLVRNLNFELVGEADDPLKTLEMVATYAPDIILLDVTTEFLKTPQIIPQLVAQSHPTRILALALHSDRRLVSQILESGASGYLLKYALYEELDAAINCLLADKIYISPEINLARRKSNPGPTAKTIQWPHNKTKFPKMEVVTMSYNKKVKDVMIHLEDYPHIPYWFTLRQAMAIVREAAIKFEGSFEPRAVLVFDEKYQLMGMLTLRDIIRGLEPKFAQDRGLIKSDPNLAVIMGDMFGPSMQEASQKPVSEVMSPIKITVDGYDPITKALFLMIKENVGMMPVLLDKKVVGMVRLSDLFKEISDVVLGD